MWDLLLKNGHVVDPLNGRDGIFDIAVEGGRIAAVGASLDGRAKAVEDCSGLLVVPGIIDAHMHLGCVYGSPYGSRMTALAGVTTCLDMAGPIDEILADGHRTGAGLNVAIMDRLEPGERYGTNDPSLDQVRDFADTCTEKGALGVKLVGGHWPLTPEACRRTIEVCNEKGYAVAWHAGTTTAQSDIEGVRQAVEIAGDMRLHLAHINSYCRGRILNPEAEAREALELLKAHPNIWSEAYLSQFNGTHLTCSESGEALDFVTKHCLSLFGLPQTADGIRTALRKRIAHVLKDTGWITEILRGEDAVREWEARGTTNVVGCFPVNAASSRLMLASDKRQDGTFTVDAFSTDGGCIPRNVIIENGLGLVKFGAISLSEFVLKASLSTARHLRLFDRGHFTEGAVADITVIDYEKAKAVETLVSGSVNMKNGVLYGRDMTIITTERGKPYVESMGYPTIIIDPSAPEPERICVS
ncbi:MAG: amidohydrolase family protein [Sutterella sp.]|nr:amidohydrolase family protein [Sutterella sp.]